MPFQPEDTQADMHPNTGGKWKKILNKKKIMNMIFLAASDKKSDVQRYKMKVGIESNKIEGRVLDFIPIQPKLVNYSSN